MLDRSKQFFNKGSYDDIQVLNELSTILMTSTEVESKLQNIAAFIRAKLGSRYCSVILRTNEIQSLRADIGDKDSLIAEVTEVLREELSKKDFPSVIIVNSLKNENKDLYRLLHDNKVAVIVKLANPEEDLSGHIVIGDKDNSSLYDGSDLLLLKIISDEFLISIQSSLKLEALQKLNLKLEEKVKESTRNLQQTRLKLKTLDQTKDEFISMASHQLRTPLTSVKGYVSMVIDGDAGEISPLQRKLLNQAFISSQRMVYLIADLLNVSRIRTGQFILEPVACNLSSVIREEVDQLVGTAKSRELEITYNQPEHFPILMLDETKLRQVVMNFIDNAIYYTPSGGSITVSLVEKPLSIEFTVVDSGMGVPKAEQHRLFTKFFRADNAKHARPDGTGLGLFMAKKVVIAQGGSIIFKSQEGNGSTFGFSFAKSKLVLAKHLADK